MWKRVSNIVVFTPLKGQGFQMSAASHGIFRRGSQGVDRKVVQKPLQCAPVGVAAVIVFHDPKLCRTVGQRV